MAMPASAARPTIADVARRRAGAPASALGVLADRADARGVTGVGAGFRNEDIDSVDPVLLLRHEGSRVVTIMLSHRRPVRTSRAQPSTARDENLYGLPAKRRLKTPRPW